MSLRNVSTRGGVKPCRFEEALFAGLAPDGGRYMPERWPRLDRDEFAALQGARYETQELIARATGRPLELRHLETRYLLR